MSLFQLLSFFPRITQVFFFSFSPISLPRKLKPLYMPLLCSDPYKKSSQVSIYARIKKAKEKHLAFFHSSSWWWRWCTSYFLNLLSKSFKKKPSVTYMHYYTVEHERKTWYYSERNDMMRKGKKKKKEGKKWRWKKYQVILLSYTTFWQLAMVLLCIRISNIKWLSSVENVSWMCLVLRYIGEG